MERSQEFGETQDRGTAAAPSSHEDIIKSITGTWIYSNRGAGQVTSLGETEKPREKKKERKKKKQNKQIKKKTASESLELVQRVPGTRQVPVTAKWAEHVGAEK